eukprot:TRINITY_DN19310_c0_g1_i1.p1 TRINITY_DN19310_c0_g1~~TRINITY_DN19310_c0_g1_i1.p1  ORF type:complete len:226 (-),score=49.56 TRINITY_DN19310_c0_g1_i1:191-868(-)
MHRLALGLACGGSFACLGASRHASAKAAQNPIVVICGPSGVGKGTLIADVMTVEPNRFGFAVSHTTRKPRPGEENGKHYWFVTHEEFEELLKNDGFLEHAKVHGNFYGTSKAAVRHVLEEKNRTCILDIDVQGCIQIHNAKIPSLRLFVRPPSVEELERRLRGRATETEESIQRRLRNARWELNMADKNPDGLFDAFVVNDERDRAAKEIKSLIDRHISQERRVF